VGGVETTRANHRGNTFFTILRKLKAKSGQLYNLSPGLTPWPVIGNFNLIGALPHRSIHELSKKHDPLMHLRFGSFRSSSAHRWTWPGTFSRSMICSSSTAPQDGIRQAYHLQLLRHHAVALQRLLAPGAPDVRRRVVQRAPAHGRSSTSARTRCATCSRRRAVLCTSTGTTCPR
jgi:hypothetical protein